MDHYKEEIELYFELRDTPESSRESYTGQGMEFKENPADEKSTEICGNSF